MNMLNTIRTTIPAKELSLWFKNVVIPFVRRVVPNGEVKILRDARMRACRLYIFSC